MHNLHTGCLVNKGEPISCHSPAVFGATFSTGVIMVFCGPQTVDLQTWMLTSHTVMRPCLHTATKFAVSKTR